MLIQVKIPREDYELYQKLLKDGHNVKLVKNGVVIQIEVENDTGIYKVDLPTEILKENINVYFNDNENGGGLTHRGHSHIVCGVNGEKLTPYFIRTHGDRALKDHAWFSIKNSYVTIDYIKDGDITIKKYQAYRKEDCVEIVIEKVWQGLPEELPNLFSKFQEAVSASVKKAHCYHCKEPYYIK